MIWIIASALISIAAITLQWFDFKPKHQRNRHIYDFQYFAVIVLFCVVPFVNVIPLLDGLLISVRKYMSKSP